MLNAINYTAHHSAAVIVALSEAVKAKSWRSEPMQSGQRFHSMKHAVPTLVRR